MTSFFFILLVFEWISFLLSVIYFRKLVRQGLLLIPVLLLFVVFPETVSMLKMEQLISGIDGARMQQIYNIMIPAQFLCMFFLFYQKTIHRYMRYIIILFSGITIALTLYLVLLKQQHFDTLNYTLESVFISACCLHYLFECMNNKTIININKDLMMYLAMGTLLLYLGTLPFHSMRNYLYKNYKQIFFSYYHLFYILNYLMYGLISFGIVWTQKK